MFTKGDGIFIKTDFPEREIALDKRSILKVAFIGICKSGPEYLHTHPCNFANNSFFSLSVLPPI